MKDKKNINEHNLDELLNKLFLEEQGQEINGNSVHFIFQQEYDVKIDATKEKELIDKLGGNTGRAGNYLNLLIVILVVVTGGLGVMLYINPAKIKSNDSKQSGYMDYKNKSMRDTVNRKELPVPVSANGKDSVFLNGSDVTGKEKTIEKPNPPFNVTDVSVYYPPSGVGSKSAATFFKPTPQDFILYNKVKNRMLEKLLIADEEIYTTIEKGEIGYRGNKIMLPGFLIRNQAITNLEYKVFLAELIKNEKTEEFKMAIVKNETWVNYNDNLLATTYFFEERYNDFPVVNISQQAALLFCSWLEKEMNQFVQQRNIQSPAFKINLPLDAQLILATREGYVQQEDCGGYNTIYDSREGIVDKAYLKQVALIRSQQKSIITGTDELFSMNRYEMNEDQLLQLFEKTLAYTDKSIPGALYPNPMHVFDKAPVSEIVQEMNTGKTRVAGACWKNKQEYSDMLKEFNKTAASPFIGFRIVVGSDKQD